LLIQLGNELLHGKLWNLTNFEVVHFSRVAAFKVEMECQIDLSCPIAGHNTQAGSSVIVVVKYDLLHMQYQLDGKKVNFTLFLGRFTMQHASSTD
jgi:hypothetical protein